MSELNIKAQAPASLWHNNPSLVHLLGLSPLLALSDSAIKGIAIGIGTLLSCMAAGLATRLLQRFIDEQWRYLWFSAILASAGSLIILALQLFWYPLFRELGVYVILIACNLALLLQMDNYFRRDSLTAVMRDSTVLGLGLLLVLCVFSALREFLITGTVLSQWQLLLPNVDVSAVPRPGSGDWFHFARLPPAGFLLLGLLIALGNRLKLWQGASLRHQETAPVKRVRVSGVLSNKSGSGQDE